MTAAPSNAQPRAQPPPRPAAGRLLRVGAVVGILVSLSPLTPSPFGEHGLASLAIGALCAVAAALWSLARTPAPRVVWRMIEPRLSALHGVVLAALAVLFAPTGLWLLDHWTFSVWRDVHGLLVPVAMAMLARRTLAEAAPFEPTGTPLGLAALLPALAFLGAGVRAEQPMLGAVGLVLAAPAVTFWLLGSKLTRSLWPVFLLGVFMLPAPLESPVHRLLMDATAAAVHPILDAVGYGVVRGGTTLEIGGYAFEIAASCSGVSTLYATAFMALTLATLSRSGPRRAALVALALPLAFATNAVRVAALIAASLAVGTDFLDTPIHKGTGAVAFLVAFAGLAWIAGSGPLRVIAGLPERAGSQSKSFSPNELR